MKNITHHNFAVLFFISHDKECGSCLVLNCRISRRIFKSTVLDNDLDSYNTIVPRKKEANANCKSPQMTTNTSALDAIEVRVPNNLTYIDAVMILALVFRSVGSKRVAPVV